MKQARPGLSLIEVLVAVLMLGMSVTTLLALQGVLSRGVFSVHATLDRIPYIFNLFTEADREKFFKQETSQTRKIENPPLTLIYRKASSIPSLISSYTELIVEQVDAEWSTAFGTCNETFARLRFGPNAFGPKTKER